MATNSQQTFGEVSPRNYELLFIRKMRGRTQSILVKDRNDQLWVVKLHGTFSGPKASANEVLGTHLCRAMGLPVPESKLMKIEEAFFNDERTWFVSSQGTGQRPAAGLHFASRFLAQAKGVEVVEFLPPMLRARLTNRSDCLGIFLFDLWAMHTDDRQALFSVNLSGVHATFIDNGHLFGGPTWSDNSFCINARMLQRVAAEEYDDRDKLDELISRMQAQLPSAYHTAVSLLPRDWYSGDDFALLERELTHRLDGIRSIAAEAVQSIRVRVEVMLGTEQPNLDSSI